MNIEEVKKKTPSAFQWKFSVKLVQFPSLFFEGLRHVSSHPTLLINPVLGSESVFWYGLFFHSALCQQGSVKFGQLTLQTRSSRPVFLGSKPWRPAGGRQNNPKK